jgi:asparaginyl-tRNA synthetase
LLQAELDFIDFPDLLDHLETLIIRVLEIALEDKEIEGYIKELNPEFKVPSRPFKRMKYADAIDWLNAQDPPILNEEGNPHVFGDDIAEAAERRMTDIPFLTWPQRQCRRLPDLCSDKRHLQETCQ